LDDLCDLFFFLCACLWHSWTMPIMYSIARLKPMFSGWEPPPGLGMRCLAVNRGKNRASGSVCRTGWFEVPAVEMHVLNTWKVVSLPYVTVSDVIICYHTFIHGKRDFESYGFPFFMGANIVLPAMSPPQEWTCGCKVSILREMAWSLSNRCGLCQAMGDIPRITNLRAILTGTKWENDSKCW
jgi:hypothetical protein